MYPLFFASLMLFTLTNQSALAAFTTPAITIVSNHSELKLHIDGNGQSGTAILLGGGPGFSSWNLEPIQSSLAKQGWKIALMDMRGIGENAETSNPNHTQLDAWIADIEAVRMHLAVDKITVIGHSWGALMAMLYAREHSDKVAHMILLNPVDPDKSAMQALTEAIHLRNLQELNINWQDDAAWDNQIETQPSQARLEQMTHTQITQVLPTYFYDYQQGQAYSKQFSHQDFNIDLNIDTWKQYDANPIQYSQIQQWPFTIEFVDCHQDPLMPYNLNAMQPNMTFSKVTLFENCGHFPWVEQPEQFKQWIHTMTQQQAVAQSKQDTP